VRDEAEIRVTGAPTSARCRGRIVRAIGEAGHDEPHHMLLDEIDKDRLGLSRDPSAALLEVLDPRRNNVPRPYWTDLTCPLSS